MRSPPPTNRRIARPTAVAGVAAVGALSLVALPAAAQQPPDQFPTTGISLWVDAVLAGIVTLIVGGGFVSLAPEYTERTTDRVLEEPGETFLYGLGIFVAAVVVIFLLAITIVGIVLAIPLVIALAVIGQLGYLAVGRAVGGEWGVVLVVAVLASAFSSGIPYLGGLVGFVLGSMGTGAWYLDYRDDGSRSGGGSEFGSSGSWGSGGSSTGEDVTDEWGSNDNGLGAAGATHGTGVEGEETETDSLGTEPADGDADGDDGADDPGDEWTAGFDDEDRE